MQGLGPLPLTAKPLQVVGWQEMLLLRVFSPVVCKCDWLRTQQTVPTAWGREGWPMQGDADFSGDHSCPCCSVVTLIPQEQWTSLPYYSSLVRPEKVA